MTKNKIDARLEQCKAEGRKALITFITAGDGGYDCTEKAVLEMAKNGADLIELGVPFSDPIAEGPVIQCASERSLRNGTTLVGIFDLVRRLRKETDVPATFMSAVSCTYFVLAPECLGKMINTYADGKLVAYNTAVAYPIGIIFAIAMLALFIHATKKHTASQKA